MLKGLCTLGYPPADGARLPSKAAACPSKSAGICMNNRIVSVKDDVGVNTFPPQMCRSSSYCGHECFGLRCILMTCFARERLAEMLEGVVQPPGLYQHSSPLVFCNRSTPTECRPAAERDVNSHFESCWWAENRSEPLT